MTFPPPDNPDWYRSTQFSGQQLDFVTNELISAGNSYVGPFTYCGNYPAIALQAVCNQLIGSTPVDNFWDFVVEFFPSGSGNPIGVEDYVGFSTCAIADNLPCVGAYFEVTVTNTGSGDATFSYAVVASLVNSRGAQLNPNAGTSELAAPSGGGLYLDIPDFINPSGPETDYPCRVLTPGWHWVELATTSDDPTAFVLLDLPLVGGTNPQIAVTPPGLSPQVFQGQIMIPSAQPRMRFINGSGAGVHQAGTLLRAKV